MNTLLICLVVYFLVSRTLSLWAMSLVADGFIFKTLLKVPFQTRLLILFLWTCPGLAEGIYFRAIKELLKLKLGTR